MSSSLSRLLLQHQQQSVAVMPAVCDSLVTSAAASGSAGTTVSVMSEPPATSVFQLLMCLRSQQERVAVISELIDVRVSQQHDAEALVLLVKCARLLCAALRMAHASVRAGVAGVVDSLTGAPVETVQCEIVRVQTTMGELLRRCDAVASRLSPGDVSRSAERLLYECALSWAVEAAVDLLYRNYIKSEYFFGHSLVLLELLLSEASDKSDAVVLRNYITRIQSQLQETMRKRAADEHYATTTTSSPPRLSLAAHD